MIRQKDRTSPIAVIDSGVGGISVLKKLASVLPNENFIYFGDSANAPYGEKSPSEVRKIMDERVGNLIERGAKAVVIACNTATSAAGEMLREKYPDIPIVGMEPAIKPAVEDKTNSTILIMATPLMIRGQKFRKLAKSYSSVANLICVPCPGLVELIEGGIEDVSPIRKLVRELIGPYIGQIDAIVLGCTHYVFVKDIISSVAGNGPSVVGGDFSAVENDFSVIGEKSSADRNSYSIVREDSSATKNSPLIVKENYSATKKDAPASRKDVRIFDGNDGTARELARRFKEADLLNPSDKPGEIAIENSSREKRMVEYSWELFKGL